MAYANIYRLKDLKRDLLLWVDYQDFETAVKTGKKIERENYLNASYTYLKTITWPRHLKFSDDNTNATYRNVLSFESGLITYL